ncbi:MAG: N-acetyltransferase [Clostridia bacterium]|nr:N-acetyltransferase [Clostridia bacterium]
MWTIRAMEPKYVTAALDMVQTVFTEHENEQEGQLVRRLAMEIRESGNYIPGLEIIAVDEADEPVGYCMFSAFHLEGRYRGELLLLSPVAVRTALQRRHISKEMIEFGFREAQRLGYRAVIVEGNPMNYRSRGFVTSRDHGIVDGPNMHLPAPECLMVKELVPGALEAMHGMVSYDEYECLR